LNSRVSFYKHSFQKSKPTRIKPTRIQEMKNMDLKHMEYLNSEIYFPLHSAQNKLDDDDAAEGKSY
jgi:hypothetical protein